MKIKQILKEIQKLNTLAKQINHDHGDQKANLNEEALAKKIDIQRQKKTDFEAKWTTFCEEIQQDIANTQSEIAAAELQNLLEQIKNNFDNIDNLKNILAPNECNNEVEFFLLPIARLAYIYEQNGIPEEHAKKLATIFAKIDDALHYLSFFAAQKDNNNPYFNDDEIQSFHNACLFTLPEKFDFKKDPKIQIWIKQHMEDPEFRNLLFLLPEIEKIVQPAKQQGNTEHNDSQPLIQTKKIEKNVWQQKQKELEKIFGEKVKNIKDLIKKYKYIIDQKNRETMDDDEENNFLEKYNYNLLTAQLELVAASSALKRKFNELQIYELKAYAAKYISEIEAFELSYFLNHQLTKKKYDYLKQLKKIDDDTRIPPIKIDGKEIGYPGYYLRRLNVESSKDAVMAACLGKLSNCCQSLSGEAGEPCTIHGLTSREGGFYVICKGDIHNPSINDQLICQSWVWRGKSNVLVIDSIESINRTYYLIELAKNFYYELAYKLIKEYNIRQINCGTKSGISKKINLYKIETNEDPKDYNGYRDSNVQFMMCDYKLLAIKESLFPRMYKVNFCATNKNFIRILSLAINNENKDLIEKYCQLFNMNMEGKKIVNLCKNYINIFEKFRDFEDFSYFEMIINKLIKYPYLVYLTNDDGNTILDFKDKDECNTLHNIALDVEALQLLLQLYPTEHEKLRAIEEGNSYGFTVLHLAASNVESLKLLLQAYPNNEEKLRAIKMINEFKSTVLHLAAASNVESLKLLLELYPNDQEKLMAIKADKNVLHSAAANAESLKLLLQLYPTDQEKLLAIQQQNEFKETVLHSAASNVESLKLLLQLYPTDQEKLLAIQQQNEFKETVLHKAASNAESLQLLLQLYPTEEEKLLAMQQKVKNGNNLLDLLYKLKFTRVEEPILNLFTPQGQQYILDELKKIDREQNLLLKHKGKILLFTATYLIGIIACNKYSMESKLKKSNF